MEEPAAPTDERAAASKSDEIAAPVSTMEAKPEETGKEAAEQEEFEEAQNPLKKKFTDAEWKGIKALPVPRRVAMLTSYATTTASPLVLQAQLPKMSRTRPLTSRLRRRRSRYGGDAVVVI